MLHVFHDLSLQGLREFLVSAESAEYPDDLFASVMQDHCGVKGELGDFILVDESRPEEWLANSFDMMVNPAVNG